MFSLRSMRILLVDDDEDAVQSLQALLTLRGQDVRSALSAADAMTVASQFAPDAILLDISLPDMDGYALCAALRDASADRRPVILAHTGWGQLETDSAGLSCFDGHIVKPAHPDDILRELQRRVPT
jgi:DNA-binding response OmpR family regulator